MDDSESESQMTRPLERVLESRREAAKEDLAREKRNYGQIRPLEFQVGMARVMSKVPTEEFRAGWDRIFGSKD